MKKIIIILLLLSPLFVQSQTGCSDSNAENYYCNTAFDCVMTGFDEESGAPIFTLPIGFVDDGSCYYNPGCSDPTYIEYDESVDFDDGSCEVIAVPGCIDTDACNYVADANVYVTCTYAETYYDCDGSCLADADGDGVCDELEVLGCTDTTAFNYNGDATDDDGSCSYAVLGCTDSNYAEYDETATDDDGSCVSLIGCTDSNYYEYNSDVVVSNPDACQSRIGDANGDDSVNLTDLFY